MAIALNVHYKSNIYGNESPSTRHDCDIFHIQLQTNCMFTGVFAVIRHENHTKSNTKMPNHKQTNSPTEREKTLILSQGNSSISRLTNKRD